MQSIRGNKNAPALKRKILVQHKLDEYIRFSPLVRPSRKSGSDDVIILDEEPKKRQSTPTVRQKRPVLASSEREATVARRKEPPVEKKREEPAVEKKGSPADGKEPKPKQEERPVLPPKKEEAMAPKNKEPSIVKKEESAVQKKGSPTERKEQKPVVQKQEEPVVRRETPVSSRRSQERAESVSTKRKKEPTPPQPKARKTNLPKLAMPRRNSTPEKPRVVQPMLSPNDSIFNESFDELSRPEPPEGQVVVRKKDERCKLKGHECACCAKYYDSLNLSPKSRAKRINAVSRHRTTYRPMKRAKTPEHFWETDFPDTPELLRRGYFKRCF